MPSPGQLVPALLATVLAVPLAAQQPKAAPQGAPEAAQQLARDVIWNELHDRQDQSHWQYVSTRTAGAQTEVSVQVETSDGPVSRVVEHNGAPLTEAQQQREARRIDDYIHDPAAIARKRRDQQQDEARLASVMQIIPAAFLFQYQGVTDDVARLSFRPNPAYVPSGYDARVLHALTGTMTVDVRQKRMIDIRGVVSQTVDIGYGLLGSVNPGSTFEIHRCQVSAGHWMTDLLDVHVHGRLLMLKSLSKDQREARSDFRPVPKDMTLAQATMVLSQAAANPSLAQLGGGAGGAQPGAAVAGVSSDP